MPLTRLRALLRHPDVENLKDITLDLQGTLSMIPHGFTRLKSLEKLVRSLLSAGPRVGFLLTSAGAGKRKNRSYIIVSSCTIAHRQQRP